MTRASKEMLDYLCETAEQSEPGWEPFTLDEVQMLAAEVRALRDELQEAVERADGYSGVVEEVENANEKLRATIARVEALCDLWLEADPDTRTHVLGDRLRAELRGPS